MIRSYTQPTNEGFYTKYKSYINTLFALAFFGSLLSASTELLAIYLDNAAEFLSKISEILRWVYVLIFILFIEMGTRFFVKGFFTSLFAIFWDMKLAKQKEYGHFVMLGIFLIGSIFFVILSINKSQEGIDKGVDTLFEFEGELEVDKTKYKEMKKGCRSQYIADSTAAVSTANPTYKTTISKAKQVKQTAQSRADHLATVNANWAKQERKQQLAVVSTQQAIIDEAEANIKSEAKNALTVALSSYSSCMAVAQDTLLAIRNRAETKLNIAKNENGNMVKNSKKVTSGFMYAGVICIIAYGFFLNFWLFRSGVQIVYELTPVDGRISFYEKFGLLLNAKIMNFSDAVIRFLFNGATVEVDKGEIKIIQKQSDDAPKPQRRKRVFKYNLFGWFDNMFYETESAAAAKQAEAVAKEAEEQARIAKHKAAVDLMIQKAEASMVETEQRRQAAFIEYTAKIAEWQKENANKLSRLEEEAETAKQEAEKAKAFAKQQSDETRRKAEEEIANFKRELEAKTKKEAEERAQRERQRLIEEQQAKAKSDAEEAEKLRQDAAKAEEAKKAAEEAKAKLVSAKKLFQEAFAAISQDTEAETEAEKQAKEHLISEFSKKGRLEGNELMEALNYAKGISQYYKRSNKSVNASTRENNRRVYEKQKKFLESVGFEVIPNAEGTSAVVRPKK